MDLASLLVGEETVLLDGAMGTQLERYGLAPGGHNNIEHPDEVLRIHREYAACGCRLLITNTLTMNRIYAETHQVKADVREANLAAARLAKEALGDRGFVLGDISSTGKMLEPYGEVSEADAYEAFKEQAAALLEGGVDGFIIETVFDLREALCALRACKETALLPVIVSMTFDRAEQQGRTIMGDSTPQCAEALTEAGADAVGANCGGVDPARMAALVALYRQATSLPVAAQPNAGQPRIAGDKTVFDMTPEAFADGVLQCVQAGARLVGGCCGTTPDHLRALARRLEIDGP